MASHDNFSRSLRLSKVAVRSSGGIVAAQHRRAAEIGARILAQGGEATDAAIATSFALGAAEPWMSGLGGGGAMVLYRAREDRYTVIDFGMRAPASLRVSDYPLAGDGTASDLFPWARVQDDRNLQGPLSVAVPGVVDGMRLAYETYATLPWRDLLRPAAALADAGLLVDWVTTQHIAAAAADLLRYPASRAAYLPDGVAPVPAWSARTEVRLPQTALAATLRHLAEAGPRDFYEGKTAWSIAKDVHAAGGRLAPSDLAAYRAREIDPLQIGYREARIAATPELTAGPTLAHTLKLLSGHAFGKPEPGAGDYTAYASALQEAYRFRLSRMGDEEGARAPACTTHFCVVDRQGNIASVTQTLLSVFGSRVHLPDTGVLMNNGIMWFDPEPDRPNSLLPGKRCLTNYCPVIGEHAGRRFAMGASGGRRILPAVVQLLSFLVDYGDSLETAFHRPRIDASEGDLVIGDEALGEPLHAALAKRFDYVRQHRLVMPFKFACPSAVLHTADGNTGATEIGAPWADAVRE